jgi:pimeloyl-ACP methyl ester carboxylesterase
MPAKAGIQQIVDIVQCGFSWHCHSPVWRNIFNSLQSIAEGFDKLIDPSYATAMQQESNTLNYVRLPDGRRLAYAEYGDPHGIPVVYCHGFPGSRLEAKLFDASARRGKLRVISADRNGLGESDRLANRHLLDWPTDVAAMADALGIDRFHLIGISGGGPYALACAHRIPDRLKGVALVCPLGPLDQPDLLKAMRWHAFLTFTSMREIPLLSRTFFQGTFIPLARYQPRMLFRMMLGMMPAPDYRVLNRPEMGDAIIASLAESVRGGAEGILHEMALYAAPWGFELEEIQLPLQLWHGTADDTVPQSHGRWLAQHLPNCDARYIEGEGHFSLPIEHMERIQEALISGRIGE